MRLRRRSRTRGRYASLGARVLFVAGVGLAALLAVSGAVARPKTERVRSSTAALRIAFSRTNLQSTRQTSEIYSINPDGTGLKRLTHNPARDTAPTWSPDHRRIAFVREIRFNQDADRIFVMRAGGGGERPLTTTLQSLHSPAWSPDGRNIAFSDADSIWIMRSDGSGRHVLKQPQDFDPPRLLYGGLAWSPDSASIAFSAYCDCDSNTPIYVMKADGSGARPVTAPGNYDLSPAWSPDGHTIAFTRVRGEGQIWVVPAAGGSERRIALKGENPSWSPDGRRLVFNGLNDRGHLRGYCQVIFRISRDGSHRAVLGPKGKIPCSRNLSFAPDDHDPAWTG